MQEMPMFFEMLLLYLFCNKKRDKFLTKGKERYERKEKRKKILDVGQNRLYPW